MFRLKPTSLASQFFVRSFASSLTDGSEVQAAPASSIYKIHNILRFLCFYSTICARKLEKGTLNGRINYNASCRTCCFHGLFSWIVGSFSRCWNRVLHFTCNFMVKIIY